MPDVSGFQTTWVEDPSAYRVTVHDYDLVTDRADYTIKVCHFIAGNLAEAVTLAEQYFIVDRA